MSVETEEPGEGSSGPGGVTAAPALFIASMRRTETPIKAVNTKDSRRRQNGDLFSSPSSTLRICFLLIFNSGYFQGGNVRSALPGRRLTASTGHEKVREYLTFSDF